MIPFPLRPVLWLLAVDLAAWAVGDALLRRCGGGDRERTWGSAIALPVAVGLPALGLATFALGVLQLLRVPVLLAVGLAGAAWGGVSLWRRRGELPRLAAPGPWSLPLAGALALTVPFALRCFQPFYQFDSLVYHLNLPLRYLEHGGIVPLPYDLYANMPHAVEVLFSLAVAGGGFTAAKLLSFQLNLLIAGGLCLVARRLVPETESGEGRWRAAWLGGLLALLYLGGPNVQWHLPLAYVEAAAGCALLFSFLLFAAWRETRRPGMLLLAAGLAGWVASVKYATWLFVAGLAAVMAVDVLSAPGWRRGETAAAGTAAQEPNSPALRRRLALLAMATGAGLLPLAPWLAKSWWMTGNPLFPNLYGLLDGRWWSAAQASQLGRSVRYLEVAAGEPAWLTWLRAPWDLVARPALYYTRASFSAPLMVLFLAAPLFLLAVPRRGAWRAAAGAAWLGFAAWVLAPFATQGRFLLALAPLMALAAAGPLGWMGRRPWAAAALTLLVAAGVAIQTHLPPVSLSALTPRGHQEMLATSPSYRLWQPANQRLPPDARLLVMFENRVLFLEREAWVDSVYEAPASMELLRRAGSAAGTVRLLRQAGITHVVVNLPVARRYLEERLPIPLTDPQTLPRAAFLRVRATFEELLARELQPLFTVGGHAFYALPAG